MSLCRQAIIRLAGPALLLALLATTDHRALWATLSATDLRWFSVSVLLGWVLLVFKGLRWQALLAHWHIRLPAPKAIPLYMLGSAVGTLTPGQSGDLVKAYVLHRAGHPLGSAVLASVLDRLIDLGVMASCALLGVAVYLTVLPAQSWLVVAGFLALLVASAVFLASGQVRRALLRGVHALLLRRVPLAAVQRASTAQWSPWLLARIAVYSTAALSLTFLRLWLVCWAADVVMPLVPFLALVGLTTLAGLLSFSGIGTRDAMMLVLLHGLAALGQLWRSDGTPIASAEVAPLAITLATLFLAAHLSTVAAGVVVALCWPHLAQQLPAPDAEPTLVPLLPVPAGAPGSGVTPARRAV